MSVRKRFYLATCTGGCEPALAMPFASAEERDEWADGHTAGMGHTVQRHEHWRDLSKPLTDEPAPSAAPQPGPDTETLLCVGGPRNGQEVSVAAGEASWLDLEHAQTYRRIPYLAGEDHPLLGRPTRMWRRDALLWEGITDGQSAVLQLANWLYGEWVKQAGNQMPVTVNPPQAQPTNGGQPQ